jgi:hypothetical protein
LSAAAAANAFNNARIGQNQFEGFIVKGRMVADLDGGAVFRPNERK